MAKLRFRAQNSLYQGRFFMNWAHLHLILTHVPIVGIPIAMVFLFSGFSGRQANLVRISLFVITALGAMTLPVFWTGEGAEEIVEHIPVVAKSSIHAHEEAAEVSLALSLITSLSGLIALLLMRHEQWGRKAVAVVLVLCGLVSLSLAYTANLGGQIRHTEILKSQDRD